MTSKVKALTFAVASGIVAVACSGNPSGPTAPGGTSGGGTTSGGAACRTYAATATEVSTSSVGPTVSGLTVTGSFDISARQFTSTIVNPGGGLCDTVVYNYRSVADFVDEVKAIPPLLTLATDSKTTIGPACGSGSSTRIYSYDSQRKLTQIAQGSSTTVYSLWDNAGRPTLGMRTGGSQLSYTYDDAARVMTVRTISGGVTSVATSTFDARGIELQEVDTGSVTTTTTWTIGSTGTVCK